MPVNKGVAPPDMQTATGVFRALIGDMTFVPLDPPVAGFGDYGMFSDDEIGAFLGASSSTEGAVSIAYLQLAGSAAKASKSVADLDLKIDLTKRSTDYRLLAQVWGEKADALAADIFEVFDTVVTPCNCTPELAARPVCGWSCGGNRVL